MKLIDIIQSSNSNLLRSKLRTILTMLAIMVGSFTLTLTLGIGEGTKDFINKQTKSFSVENSLIVTAKGSGSANPLSSISEVQEYKENQGEFGFTYLNNSDKEKLEKVQGVEKVFPAYNLNTEYIQKDKDGKRYRMSLSALYPGLKPALASGKQPEESEKNSILISKRYLEPLGLGSTEEALGKEVVLTFKNVVGESRTETLRISGVLVDTIVAGGASYITAGLEEELYRFQVNNSPQLIDRYFGLFAVTRPNLSPAQVTEVKNNINNAGYTAQTLEDQIQTIQSFITILQTSLSVFGGIAILAATFGIVNTLLMSVYERTREIGLMKALGMKSGGVFSMFAFEALSIGFWGGVLGIALGIGIGTLLANIAGQTFLKNFEGFNLLIFPPLQMLMILGGTMLVGLLAGTLPAIKASRLNPIEALRYE